MQEVPRVHPSNFFARDRHFFERGTMKDFEEFWRPTSFQLEHKPLPRCAATIFIATDGSEVHAPFFWNGRCDVDTLGGLNPDVVLAGAPSIVQGIGGRVTIGGCQRWHLPPPTSLYVIRSTCFPQHHDLASQKCLLMLARLFREHAPSVDAKSSRTNRREPILKILLLMRLRT